MNKKIIVSSVITLPLLLAGVGLLLYWPQISRLLAQKIIFFSPEVSPISIVDNSQNVDISVDLPKLTKIYNDNVTFADENTRQAFDPIVIELTDQRQANAYFWDKDEMYESIAVVKTAPTSKKVVISVNPAYMEQYGWSKRTIEQELEVLFLQGLLTQLSLTLTSAHIEENRLKAVTILDALEDEQFVTLQ
jgi:hypothetical protein